MSGRRKRDYVAVLQAILDLLPGDAPRVVRFMADFEAAVWRAVRVALPAVQLKGCSFHLRQAIYQQVRSIYTGIQVLYGTMFFFVFLFPLPASPLSYNYIIIIHAEYNFFYYTDLLFGCFI